MIIDKSKLICVYCDFDECWEFKIKNGYKTGTKDEEDLIVAKVYEQEDNHPFVAFLRNGINQLLNEKSTEFVPSYQHD